MSDNSELVKEFLVESYENLDRLDGLFIDLEKDPRNLENIGGIFRTIHTIKGTCGFFGFERLQSLTHAGESLLSKMRDAEISLTPEITDSLLALVDAVRTMLKQIEASGGEGENGYLELILKLTALLETPNDDFNAANSTLIDDNQLPPTGLGSPGTLTSLFESANPAPTTSYSSTAKAIQVPGVPGVSPVSKSGKDQTASPAGASATQPSDRSDTAKTTSIEHSAGAQMGTTREIHSESHHKGSDSQRHEEPKSDAHGLADTTIRVDVVLLDRLMKLVGELVLARNRIMQFTTSVSDKAFVATSQRLNLLTSELQEGVMKTRMQPIGNIWSKFPRVVRDLSLSIGKQVRIEMEGKQTELDKTLIEAIKDPLTHIVRNSIDHGIEMPEIRASIGKPAEGLLSLRAYHEGGQVIIEISDDGGGINPQKVKAKAIEKGLITAQQANQLDERGMVALIFLPGFSTAEKVTNISGRGVGMDVVKTNIERIGGHVEVQNRVGLGTTIKIKIPLTLAIIPALLISSGGERFAIPQVSLIELVRLDSSNSLEQVYGAPVYRLRGHLLPIVFLNQELGLTPAPADAVQNLIVLQADERRFGLVVDAIYDAEEIVVKPLDQMLKGLLVYAGATILGDGQVALILDVLGLGMRSHAVDKSTERMLENAAAALHVERQALLLFTSPDDGRMAIPLSKVTRLEELASASVERVGGNDVVQLRGEIIPLVYVFQHLPERRKEPRNPDCGVPPDIIQLVIHSANGHQVGLVVGRILDAVDAPIPLQRAAGRRGVLGCLVIEDWVTELLDVEGMVRETLPHLYDQLQSNTP